MNAKEGAIQMISAWWLLPAAMLGAVFGVVVTCLAVVSGRNKTGG